MAEVFVNFTAQTTLAAAITAGATSLQIVATAASPTGPQFRIRIDDELMLVTGVAGTTYTVTRGIEGTTAAAHDLGDVVRYVVTAAALGGQSDPAAATPGLRSLGTGAQQAAAGNDARLSDARTPTAHASTHHSGGSDPLAGQSIAGLLTSSTPTFDRLKLGAGSFPNAWALTTHGGGVVMTGTAFNVAAFLEDETNYRGIALGYDSASQTGIVAALTASAASNIAFWTYSGAAWGERARLMTTGFQVGGRVLVGTDGVITWGNAADYGALTWDTGKAIIASQAGKDLLFASATHLVEVRNGMNPQSLYLYNTYTDGSNYERGLLAWQSNVFVLGTAKAGTGTDRALRLTTNSGTDYWEFEAGAIPHFFPLDDNVYNIGKINQRPSSIFVASTIQVGGTASADMTAVIGSPNLLQVGNSNNQSQFALVQNAAVAVPSYLEVFKTRDSSGAGADTDVQNADRIFALRGWAASGGSYFAGAMIQYAVDGTFTTGQRPPSRIEFYANAANGAQTKYLQINNAGAVQMAAYGAGTATFDASGNITSASDERLKAIQDKFRLGLSAIQGIEPILYKWKPESGYDQQDTYAGFSAQNVASHVPLAVGQSKDGYMSLQDRALMAVIVNAIKELDTALAALKTQVGKPDKKP